MDFLTDAFLVDPETFDGPVLVTGAGGCIGAWVLAILTRSSVPVVAFDLRDDRRRPSLMLGEEGAAALTWETGDIADARRLTEVAERHGIRSIIHLAGLQVPFCKANPAAGARVNVEGTINVLEIARHAGLKRIAYASSSAVHGMPPGGPVLATLYGAYKLANEYTAKVFWLDWGVPSVGIRPNVVYGVARDQGMSASFTVAIAKAVLGEAYEIPFNGPISWLYGGEAASAFIGAVRRDGDEAHVFDLNGGSETIENGLKILSELEPDHGISISGQPLAIPHDLDDEPIRAHLGDLPSISPRHGIEQTHRAFQMLRSQDRLTATA
ncbi:MAG: SDR family oxidoreductase [Bauldia sp.]|uniref:NAD-dependent epimerase/dehydratase family protein n=1 Tax=Bauldia sp. TaxID=2575872 RepID=UPI001DB08B14|nr:SDR family oxidoreductase [Bauldia sp.]MCB1497587.1 SDR family oxidoreductase [Bauldia sp.]